MQKHLLFQPVSQALWIRHINGWRWGQKESKTWAKKNAKNWSYWWVLWSVRGCAEHTHGKTRPQTWKVCLLWASLQLMSSCYTASHLYVPYWHIYKTCCILLTLDVSDSDRVGVTLRKAAMPVTTVQDCVSTSVGLEPRETSGQFPAMFDQARNLKPKYNLFLTRTKPFMCVSLTRQYAQHCQVKLFKPLAILSLHGCLARSLLPVVWTT